MKIKQSGAIVILCVIVVISYFFFLRSDLVGTTLILKSQCLEGSRLCATCIKRSQLDIANQSNIYIVDETARFKVMVVPREGFLTCEEMLQFASYELPMSIPEDIIFEQLGPTAEIIKLLGIRFTEEPVKKFEMPADVGQAAVFKLQAQQTPTTLLMFAGSQEQHAARQYGQFVSAMCILATITTILTRMVQEKQFRPYYLVVACIGLMVLAESSLDSSAYLLTYAASLMIGYLFATNSFDRVYTMIALILSISLSFTAYFGEGLVLVMMIYLVLGKDTIFLKVGTLGTFALTTLTVCWAFKDHNHWLSLALRRIIEYTALSVSPLLIEFIKSRIQQKNYVKLPVPSNPSGISLPGFEPTEENNSSDQEQN